MNIQTIESTTQRYSSKVNLIKEKFNRSGSSSFIDIVGNLLSFLSTSTFTIKEGNCSWQELRTMYLSELRDLKVYLSLMERYPEFAKKELNGNVFERSSMFPEIRDIEGHDAKKLGYHSPNQAYIYLAKQKLESRLS